MNLDPGVNAVFLAAALGLGITELPRMIDDSGRNISLGLYSPRSYQSITTPRQPHPIKSASNLPTTTKARNNKHADAEENSIDPTSA